MRLPVTLEALALRATLPAMIRLWPLDRVLGALARVPAAPAPRPESLATIGEVTELVTRKLRPTRTACLGRAVMRFAMLRRAGHAAGFVIGVRSGGRDGFEAHAWVTLDGKPWLEREPLERFRPTFCWPAASSGTASFHSFR